MLVLLVNMSLRANSTLLHVICGVLVIKNLHFRVFNKVIFTFRASFCNNSSALFIFVIDLSLISLTVFGRGTLTSQCIAKWCSFLPHRESHSQFLTFI